MTLQEAVKKLQKEASEIYYEFENNKTKDALEYNDPKIAVLDIAIDCIGKQIAIKPLKAKVYYLCPSCKEIVEEQDYDWYFDIPNYCPNCGQKIDWGGQK